MLVPNIKGFGMLIDSSKRFPNVSNRANSVCKSKKKNLNWLREIKPSIG